MNSWMFGGGAGLVAVLYFIYRYIMSNLVTATIQKTADEDKSLQQQQLENQQKLAQVNKDLDALYAEREKMRQQYLDNQQKVDIWNQKPPEQP